jgi:hypothetical protein
LEYLLRACPKLESSKRKNFVQVPPPLSAMSMDQVEVARFFQEVFKWDNPFALDCLPVTVTMTVCRSTTTTTT